MVAKRKTHNTQTEVAVQELSWRIKLYWLLLAIVLLALLAILAPVLQPFYIAALIAYLSNPLVERFEKQKIPRILGVIIVFLLGIIILITLGLFLIPLLFEQINLLFGQLPALFTWLQQTVLPWLNSKLSTVPVGVPTLNVAVVEGLKSHQDIIGKIIATITTSSVTVISLVFQLLLIPVVSFYLLRDWNKLVANIRRILPRAIEPTVSLLVKRYNEVLRAFVRGQLLIMILLGLIYTLGLWLVGLQLAVLIGVVAGLLNIVPYLGFSIGLISALIAGYYQFGELSHLFYIILVFAVGQSIESMVLTPLLVGDRIGLHPVAVIFSVLTGAYFFGFLGALFALPVAAAIMVLVRYGLTQYYRSSLYR